MIFLQALTWVVVIAMGAIIALVALAPFVLSDQLSKMERSEGRWNEEVPE